MGRPDQGGFGLEVKAEGNMLPGLKHGQKKAMEFDLKPRKRIRSGNIQTATPIFTVKSLITPISHLKNPSNQFSRQNRSPSIMSNSPSLSFGPDWMRPRGSNTSINHGPKSNNEFSAGNAPRFPSSSPSSPSLPSSKLAWGEMGFTINGAPQPSHSNGTQHPSRHGSPLSFAAGSSNLSGGTNFSVDKMAGVTGYSGYPKGASSFKNGFNLNPNGDPSSPHSKNSTNLNSNSGFSFTNSPLGSTARLHHGGNSGQSNNNHHYNGNSYGHNNSNSDSINHNNNNNGKNTSNNNNNSSNSHRNNSHRNHYSFKILRENLGGKKYSPEEMLEIWKEMEAKGSFDQSEPLTILDEAILKGSLPICFSDVQEKPISSEPRKEKPDFPSIEPSAANTATSVINSLLSGIEGNDININSRINSPSATPTSKFSHLSRPNLESSNSSWSPFGNNNTASLASSTNVSRVGTPIDEHTPLFGAGLSRTTSRVFMNNNNSTTSLSGNININNNIHAGNIMNSPLAVPPGLSLSHSNNQNAIPAMVSPDKIEWIYKDPSGNEQGPFTGISMHEWYINNWLTDDLLIRRAEEVEFTTLTELITKIDNNREPFLTPLPAVNKVIMQQTQAPSYFDNMNFTRRTEDPLNRQLLHQKSVSQLPQLQSLHLQNQTNNTWGSPMASPTLSPWASPAQPTFNHSSSMFDLNTFGNSNYQSSGQNTNQQNSFGMNINSNQLHNGYDNVNHAIRQPSAIGNNILNASSINSSGVNLNSLDNNSILSPLKNANNLYDELASNIGSLTELGVQNLKSDVFNPTFHNDRGLSNNNFDLVQDDEDAIIKTPFEKPVSAIEPPKSKSKSALNTPTPIISSVSSSILDPRTTKATDKKLQEEQKPVPASMSMLPEKSKKSKKNKSKTSVSELLSNAPTGAIEISRTSDNTFEKEDDTNNSNENMAINQEKEETQAISDDSFLLSIETAPIAPWAKKETVSSTKTLTLREIQELEAVRAKERKVKEQAANQAALIDIARAAAFSEAQANAPILPSGAKWGSALNSSLNPKKTIAEIQREEVEASRKAPAGSSLNSSSSHGTSLAAALSSNSSERRYVDMATKIASSKPVSTGTSFAASLAVPPISLTPSTVDGAWTTVSNSKKLSSAPISSTSATPVRPVAPIVPTSRPVTTDVAKSQSDEFVMWCKSSLRGLDAGIDQTDLLSMFLSLPSNAETSEIIADSIYANSSTLDGRRFATEFFKRRTAVEKEDAKASITGTSSIKGSWSDVLQRTQVQADSPENDGWNTAFKVVGKKKNMKKI